MVILNVSVKYEIEWKKKKSFYDHCATLLFFFPIYFPTFFFKLNLF